VSRAVLDASAMLAFVCGEPGGEIVDGYRGDALASAVNVAETAARLVDLGLALDEIRRSIAHMSLDIVPFDKDQALAAADMRLATRHRGLSLGDRACLQLAAHRGLPAVTADRAWAELDVDTEVRVIRDSDTPKPFEEDQIMSVDWREDVGSALRDFAAVSELAGERADLGHADVEFLRAPHKPGSLPKGKMAVYGFWWDGTWLKIGKAGEKSNARYVSQHYTGNAPSSLAGSIRNDERMRCISDLDGKDLAAWIKRETSRVNILLPATRNKALMSLLEAFLHVRLHPRYEG